MRKTLLLVLTLATLAGPIPSHALDPGDLYAPDHACVVPFRSGRSVGGLTCTASLAKGTQRVDLLMTHGPSSGFKLVIKATDGATVALTCDSEVDIVSGGGHHSCSTSFGFGSIKYYGSGTSSGTFDTSAYMDLRLSKPATMTATARRGEGVLTVRGRRTGA